MIEGKTGEPLGRRIRLRKDQFQFIAAGNFEACARLRADANPIDARRRRQRTVGLDRDPKAAIMQRADESLVELEQWLSAREHAQPALVAADPLGFDRAGEFISIAVTAAFGAVGADEIGVAETANRGRAISLAARP